MASAAKRNVTVTKPVEETRVVLELTEEEANFLVALVGMHVIGVSEMNSNIHGALYDLGYDYYLTPEAKAFSQKMIGQVRVNG